MAENSLPIQIEISVDEASSNRTYAQIKQKAEQEGRKLGQSLTEGFKLSPRAIEEQIVSTVRQSRGGARKEMERLYNDLFRVESAVTSLGTKGAIESRLINEIRQASGSAKSEMERMYADLFKVDSVVTSVGAKGVIESRIINEIKQASGSAKVEIERMYADLFKVESVGRSMPTKGLIESKIVGEIKQVSGSARQAIEQMYSDLFRVDSLVKSTSTKNFIESRIQSEISSVDRSRLQSMYDGLFGQVTRGSLVRSVGTKNLIESRIVSEISSVDRGRLQNMYDDLFSKITPTKTAFSGGSKNLMADMLAGSDDATRRMAVLQDQATQMNAKFVRQSKIMSELREGMGSVALMTTQLTRAFFGLSLATGLVTAPAMFGGKFLKDIEDAKIGIAGIAVSMLQVNGSALTAQQGLQVADDIVQQLTQNAHKYGLSVADVIGTFRGIMASTIGRAGMTIKEIQEIATLGTLGVKALGMNATQVIQEVRDLAGGSNIQPGSSTFATALGLNDAQIKAAIASAEGLYQFLIRKISGFGQVAQLAREQTFSGLVDTIKIKLQQAFADESIYSGVKVFLKGLSDSIGTLDITGKLTISEGFKKGAQEYLWIVEQIFKVGKAFLGLLTDAASAARSVNEATSGLAASLGVAFMAYKAMPKTLSDEFAKSFNLISGMSNSAAKNSTESFIAAWKATESKTSAVGLAIGTALRWGIIAGFTGLIAYELAKEFIAPLESVQKASLQVVGGFLMLGAVIKQGYKSILNDLQWLIEAPLEMMSSGIKNLLSTAAKGAEKLGMTGPAQSLNLAASVFTPPKIGATARWEARQISIDMERAKVVSDVSKAYDELTFKYTEVGKAQEKINTTELQAKSALASSISAIQAKGKELHTASAKLAEYKSLLIEIDTNEKRAIKTAKESIPDLTARNATIDSIKMQSDEQRKAAELSFKTNKDSQRAEKERIKGIEQDFKREQQILDAQYSLKEKQIDQAVKYGLAEDAANIIRKSSAEEQLQATAALQDSHIKMLQGLNNLNAAQTIERDNKIKDIQGTRELIEVKQRENQVLDEQRAIMKNLAAEREIGVSIRESGQAATKMIREMDAEHKKKYTIVDPITFAVDMAEAKFRESRQSDLDKYTNKINVSKDAIESAELSWKSGITTTEQFLKVTLLQSEAINKATEAYNKQQAAVDKDADAVRKKAEEDAKYNESFKGGTEQAFNEYTKGALTAADMTRQAFGNTFKAMEDGLVEFVKTGKLSFGSFVNTVIDGLIRMAAKAAVTNLGQMAGLGSSSAGAGIGGFMGGIGSLVSSFFANGAAFDGIKKYAKGAAFGAMVATSPMTAFANGGAFTNGIYNKPTMFQFADGGKFNLGVMGEGSRAEAVMPLERGPKGLGVINYGAPMGGSGESNVVISVQVNIEAGGNSDVQTNAGGAGMGKGIGDLIGAKVRDVILVEQRPGGMLNRSR